MYISIYIYLYQEAQESNRNGWNRTDWNRNRKNWNLRTGAETGIEIHEPDMEPILYRFSGVLPFFWILWRHWFCMAHANWWASVPLSLFQVILVHSVSECWEHLDFGRFPAGCEPPEFPEDLDFGRSPVEANNTIVIRFHIVLTRFQCELNTLFNGFDMIFTKFWVWVLICCWRWALIRLRMWAWRWLRQGL